MVYRFVIISDEVQGFRRDILMDSSATFLELKEAIFEELEYDKGELTLFQLTDSDWRPLVQIQELELRFDPEEMIYLMDQVHLEELLQEEKQKLLFTFDLIGDRCFFIEMREIVKDRVLKSPEVIRSEGKAPRQFTSMDELMKQQKKNSSKKTNNRKSETEEEFDAYYDSEGYNEDEVNLDDFEISEE